MRMMLQWRREYFLFNLSFLLFLLSERRANAFAGLESSSVVLDNASFLPQHLHHLPQTASVLLQQSGSSISHFYSNALDANPLATQMATGGSLALVGDALAQRQQQNSSYDTVRASSFVLFDIAYRALQHVAFPLIVQACHGQYLGSILPFPTDLLAAVEQTLVNQLGIVPFLYYPVFFLLTGFIQNLSWTESWQRAQETFPVVMPRNLLFWVPVQYYQFRYLPADYHIPFVCVAGLCWTVILSLSAGSTATYAKEQQQQLRVLETTPTTETTKTSARVTVQS